MLKKSLFVTFSKPLYLHVNSGFTHDLSVVYKQPDIIILGKTALSVFEARTFIVPSPLIGA